MRHIYAAGKTGRPAHVRLWVVLLATLACAPAGQGLPPIDPLPCPEYSFDLESCQVDGGVFDAGDVLLLLPPDPNVIVPGAALGLSSSDDDLDGLSADNASVAPADTFALLFSIDSASVGAVPPAPELVALCVPYNAMDQAARGHAAGDQYMSTRLFTLQGSVTGPFSNNALVRNNYDEGGTDFSALPPVSACDTVSPDAADDVDATGQLAYVEGEIAGVYFSATSTSPSLWDGLPHYGDPSGADIYFNESPSTYAPTVLYASYDQLQLLREDDIDALIVFDFGELNGFDEPDRVLFSLAPGSPSLATIPGASSEGAAADVFIAAAGQPPQLFASAAELGLGASSDNIDALDFVPCNDALLCAEQHGIRSARCDLDGDGDVDVADLALLLGAYGSCTGGPGFVPAADIDGSGCIDIADLAELLSEYGICCP